MLHDIRYAIAFVSDAERAKRFYRDTLGLRVKFDAGGWVEMETGGVTLALHDGVKPPPAGAGHDGPHVGIGFAVDSVGKAHAHLAGKGVAFTRGPTPIAPGRFVANFRDPDGNELSIGGPA